MRPGASPGGRPPSSLRVGAVGYANALPLLAGLAEEPGMALAPGTPAEISARLSRAEVDVGLLPVVELLQAPDLVPFSDACVAAAGRVQSVVLLLRTSPYRLRRVALDPHSRTSRVLLRLCLREIYGVEPVFLEGSPVDPRGSEREVDGALLIGDRALAAQLAGEPHLDLGQEWWQLTGLPFVFALWVGRSELLERNPDLPGRLAAARDRGLADLERISIKAAARLGIPAAAMRVYLERRIRYRLGARERAGMERFLSLAPPFLAADQRLRTESACSTSGSSVSIGQR